MRPRGDRTGGFTLIELTIALVISALLLSFAGLTFGRYYSRSAARRAAQVFSQDLTEARTLAVRSQSPVVIRFYETSRWYEVELQSTASEVSRRRFEGASADIALSGVTLDLTGDSLVFNARGIADLSGAGGSLGTATFSSGATTYRVSFNSMGASKIEAL